MHVQYAATMKAALTRDQLQQIQERNSTSADVRTLLWEIKRLRALTLRTHDYVRQDATSSTAAMLGDRLREDLENEPCVKEQPTL
jgi:cell fate (sporulation/competence/biofilm development) regulator YmcA (YheA/YmcA/DUF963 family)